MFQYIVPVIVVGWMSWVSLSVITQGRTLTKILKNCELRTQSTDEKLEHDQKALGKLGSMMGAMNRNLVRMAVSLGMPGADEMEELPDGLDS